MGCYLCIPSREQRAFDTFTPREAMRVALWLVLTCGVTLPATGQPAPDRPFGTLRAQAAIQQAWLQQRLETRLPSVMRAHGVDMWVVAMREYNEDPVFRALVAPTTFAARRRTIYVFVDRGADAGIERIALGGGSQGDLYDAVRATEAAPDGRPRELWGAAQWDLFAQVVRDRHPRRIAVDISAEHNFADGLSAGEWEQMRQALGPDLAARVVREPRLAIDYLALRVPEMLPVYRRMQELVHAIIAEAFSATVITPGVTTTEDVVWWMRQRVNDLGLGTWFQPSVDVQRRGVDMGDSTAPVILRGDLLHCDFGITALGLNTDTQHMAYVLRDGETEAPPGLRAALAASNRLQDITMREMRPNRTGNEVLAATLARMRADGIDGTVYSHPIGDHGHAAGPLIGLWDRQDGVPGRGEVPLLSGMWFSIELQAATRVPEWGGQLVRSMQEEDAELGEDGQMRWILRRQETYHVVR
jgi:Xaa-Pro aminopeptidase